MKKISLYIIKLYVLFIGINCYGQQLHHNLFDNITGGWDFYLLDQYTDTNEDISTMSGVHHIQGGTNVYTNSNNYDFWFERRNNNNNINNTGLVIPISGPPNGFIYSPTFRQGNILDTVAINNTILCKKEEILNPNGGVNYNFAGYIVFKDIGGSGFSENSFFSIKMKIVTNGTTTTPVDFTITPTTDLTPIANFEEISAPDNYRLIRFTISLNLEDIVDFCDTTSKIIIETITSEEDPENLKVCAFFDNLNAVKSGDQILDLEINPYEERQYCINTAYNLIEPSFNATSGTGAYTVTCNGNNCPASSYTLTPNNCSFHQPGNYTVTYTYIGSNGCVITRSRNVNIVECPIPPCQYCTSFELQEGHNYTISGWASMRGDEVNFKEIPSLINFDDCKIAVEFFDNNGTTLLENEFSVTGSIIDGWQKIKGDFNVPVGTTDMVIRLINNSTKAALFDDIRVHPKDGTMKSFVYDAETKKLMAELDENNYATFYEYDIEGGLVRVKKETERGVNTIQETRSNTVKKENND